MFNQLLANAAINAPLGFESIFSRPTNICKSELASPLVGLIWRYIASEPVPSLDRNTAHTTSRVIAGGSLC